MSSEIATQYVKRRRGASVWPVLAALRFFLAMVVVLGHCSLYVFGRHSWTFIGLWLNQGSAVFGFFIISGYSIAASLESGAAGFYRRRLVRIWPLYIVCILCGLIVSHYVQHRFTWPSGGTLPPIALPQMLAALFMLQTIAAAPIGIIGPTWSLATEWWHYMAAPALKNLSVPALVALLAASFLAFMIIPTPPGGGPDQFKHGLSVVTLSWLWMTGFVYRRFDASPFGIVILMAPSTLALYFGHFTGLPLFMTIFTLVLSGEAHLSAEMSRICIFLGDLSFPVYLFHMPIIVLLLAFHVVASVPILITILGFSILVLFMVDYPARGILRGSGWTGRRLHLILFPGVSD